MTDLKPNGISHSVMPENPITNYNDWMQYIRVRRIVTKHYIKKLEAQNQSK